jgi:hypothetical protein
VGGLYVCCAAAIREQNFIAARRGFLHASLEDGAVVGNGIVGHGIAEVFAASGAEVIMIGRTEESLARAVAGIGTSLEEFARRDLLDKGDPRLRAPGARTVVAVRKCPKELRSNPRDKGGKRRAMAQRRVPGAKNIKDRSNIRIRETIEMDGTPVSSSKLKVMRSSPPFRPKPSAFN